MKRSKLLWLLLSGFILTGCSSFYKNGGGTPSKDSLWDKTQDSLRNGKQTLDFYSLNDLHGSVAKISDGSTNEPGINLLSSYLLSKKNTNKDGFVLTSSGDMWQGSADSNITKGRLVTDWMNYLNFDAMAVGNHEFDWTIDCIKSNKENMNFPLLACNIIQIDSGKHVDWVEPYTTITRKGVHIGIIGAIGEGLTGDILSKNVRGLKFDNPTSYVKKYSTELRNKGADVILLLLHDSADNISSDCAKAIDLAFTGHTHTGENEALDSNRVPAIQAYSNGKDVGHIKLTYDFGVGKVSSATGEINDTRSLSSYTPDAGCKAIYDKYLEEEILEITTPVYGYTKTAIKAVEIPHLYNKYAYQYYLDEYDPTDSKNIYFVETNNARGDIVSGDITYGSIFKALPFDNFLTLCEVTTSVIRNDLSTYSSAHFYIPETGTTCNGSEIRYYLPTESKVNVLMIDYIAWSTRYEDKIKIVKEYTEDGTLPRNIFARYVGTDFPKK